MFSTSTYIIFAIFMAYCISQIYIGYMANKAVKGAFNFSEYFLGGRTLGTFVLMLTMGATLYSGLTTFGLPGMFYNTGVGFYYMPVAKMAFTILGITIGIRIWHLGQKFSFITPTDIFGSRYESNSVRVVSGLLFLILSIFHIGVQSMAAGLALSGVTGGEIPEWFGATIFAVVVLIYVTWGGLRAVAWTDVVQGLLLIFGIWLCALVVVVKLFAGPADLMSQVAAKMPSLLSIPGPKPIWTYSRLLTSMLVAVLGMPLAVSMFQRWYMGRSPAIIRKTSLWLPLWMGFSAEIPIIIIVFGARLLLPPLKNADLAFVEMMRVYFPIWGTSVFVIAALAAMMSTVDSFLLTNSSIIVHDFLRMIPRFAKKDESFLVRVSQVVGVLVLAFSVWWAVTKPLPYVFDAALMLMWPGQLQLFPSLLGALYWRRASKLGALTSILGGVFVLIAYHPKIGFIKAPLDIDAGILGFIAGSILFIVVSLLTKPNTKEHLDKWYGHLEDTTPDLRLDTGR